jgi:hypothetical protein
MRKRKLYRSLSRKTDGPIPHKFHVHHCDFNHENNHPDNLVQIPADLHAAIHRNPEYKPSKKEIIERILPGFDSHDARIRESKEAILREMEGLTKRIFYHPDKSYLIGRCKMILNKKRNLKRSLFKSRPPCKIIMSSDMV